MPDAPVLVDPETEVEAVAGAADQGAEPAATKADPPETAPADLGDAGKKALATLRAEVKAEKAEKAALAARLKALEDAETDRNRTVEEREKEQSRRDAESAATAKANQRLLRSEVRAAAAGKLKDPLDALAFLDLGSITVSDDGDVDQAQVAEAIAELLEKRPYLGAEAKSQFVKADTAATRKAEAAGPKQLTREDMDKMSAEQIMKAQKAGQFDNLLKKAH